jgi:DNA-binding protein Fis
VVGSPSLSESTPLAASDEAPLEAIVYERISAYVGQLQGHAPEDMYRLIMPQLERPLIRVALELAGGERQRAAKMLGIHRNTLRKRMRDLGLEPAGARPDAEAP